MATVTSLSFHIFAHYHGSPAFNRARRDLRDTNDQFHRSLQKSRDLAKSFSNLTTAALALGPALIPIGAHLSALTAGFLAVSAAASAAAGTWAAALLGAITRAKELRDSQEEANKRVDAAKEAMAKAKPGTDAYKNAQRELNAALKEQAAVGRGMPKVYTQWNSSVTRLTTTWNKFVDRMAPHTLGPAITVVDALSGSIRKFEPVVKAVSPIVENVAAAFARWTQSSTGLDRFIGVIIKYGVPALRLFADAGRNILTVMGIGFRAFLPLGMQVVQTLRKGSIELMKWAQGGGFARFIEKVQQNGPAVREFFRALGGALSNIGQALARVAPLSLMLATMLAKIVAAIPVSWLATMIQMFIIWRTAMMGLMIVRGLITIFLFFKNAIMAVRVAWFILSLAFTSTPLGWLVLAIGALVTAIVLIATKTTLFQTAWKYTWNFVKAVAGAVWGWLKKNWKLLLTVFLLALGPGGWIFAALLNWKKVWNGIKAVARAVWGFLRTNVFSPMKTFFTKIIPDAAGVFKRGIVGAFNWVKQKISAVWNWIKKNVIDKLLGAFKNVKNALGKLLDKIPGGGALKKIGGFLGKLNPFAVGGPVMGPGTGTSDSIIARLSNGEHVWTAREVQGLGGHAAVKQLRRMAVGRIARFASGGAVGGGGGGVGAAVMAPSGAAVKAAKSATGDAIQNIILPVASLFAKTVPQAANTMQQAVGQKWTQLKQGVAAQANGVAGATTKLRKSWIDLTNQSTSAAKGQMDSANKIGGSWRNMRNNAVNHAGGMVKNAFAPVKFWQQSNLPRSAQSMSQGVRNAWSQTKSGLVGTYGTLVRTVYNPTKHTYTRAVPQWSQSMRSGVTRAFTQMRQGVATQWAGIRGATRDPVNWVIKNTYGRGIRTLWNAVAAVIFGKGKRTLPAVRGLAVGGPVRGPGTGTSDSIPAMLSNNEHVWTAREVRAAGGHQAVAAMRSKVLGGSRVRMFGGTGHFAEGGAPGGGSLTRGMLLPWIAPRMQPVKVELDRKVGKATPFRDLVRTAMQTKITEMLDFVAKDDAANMIMGMANGFVPFRAWRAGDQRRVTYRGVTLNARSREMMMKAEGIAKRAFSAFQGSWSNAAASAGTHSGGGAIDVGPAQDSTVGAMRASGWAAWRRTPAEGFSPHVHGIAVGDPTVSPGAAAQVRAFFAGRNGLANNGPDTYTGGSVGAAGAKAYARAYMAVMGWGSNQWPHLEALWQRESGWNPRAKNPSSGAYGIPQALPASKMASEGRDYLTNAATQIRWGEKYIKGRYGTPAAANAFQRSHNWYSMGGAVRPPLLFDEGGILPRGISLVSNETGKPEPLRPIDRNRGSGGDVPPITFNNCVFSGSQRQFEDMVVKAVTEAKRKKRI